MTSDIWVLADDRIGGLNQAIALAEQIGKSYEVKHIQYNILANIPNLLLPTRPVHINASALNQFDAAVPPKIIISYGRRPAKLAIYLKRKFNNTVKIIQLMRPCLDLKQFDLVILPKHDKIAFETPNVVRITGALNNIKLKEKSGLSDLAQYYPEVTKCIAVILGGNTKKYKFSPKLATKFANILSCISKNHCIPLFISFSRRTPDEVKKIIRDSFKYPHIIYDPTTGGPNPYLGMIFKADYVITTADSISICSEVASSGKPLYIFCPHEFNSKKHTTFIKQLIDIGAARIIDDSIQFLEEYLYTPLSEVQRVAKVVNNLNF